MSELDRLVEAISEKSDATIKTYTRNYVKLYDILKKDLKNVSLEEMINCVSEMSDSYASQKSYANVWSICNHKLLNKETSNAYIEYVNELHENIKDQLHEKHQIKKENVIDYDDLLEHEDKLYDKKEFDKRINSLKLQSNNKYKGVVKKYINSVSSASKGCITD